MRLRGGKGDGRAGGQRVRKGRVAGERDMRREGAGIGGEIRLRKRADKPVVQGLKRRLTSHAQDEDAVCPAAEAVKALKRERRRGERGGAAGENVPGIG